MLDVAARGNLIRPMSDAAIGKVRELEAFTRQLPQQPIATSHLFHAGIYARSITIPAGVVLTGALIRIATLLIISGDVIMYVDGAARELRGYHVIAAAAHRKQVFVALSDTQMTMLFPTRAKIVAEAEEEFTGEADLLLSRGAFGSNTITVTGE